MYSRKRRLLVCRYAAPGRHRGGIACRDYWRHGRQLDIFPEHVPGRLLLYRLSISSNNVCCSIALPSRVRCTEYICGLEHLGQADNLEKLERAVWRERKCDSSDGRGS